MRMNTMELVETNTTSNPLDDRRDWTLLHVNACEQDEAAKTQDHLQSLLRQTGVCEMRRVRIQLSGGVVRLLGDVSRFYFKQLAQESLRGGATGMRIDNQLSVHSSVR